MKIERPPQTPEEAIETGWTWLGVKCVRCKHERLLALDKFRTSDAKRPIAALIPEMKCRACERRRFDCSLVVSEVSGGQPWRYAKAITFEGNRTIPTRRD